MERNIDSCRNHRPVMVDPPLYESNIAEGDRRQSQQVRLLLLKKIAHCILSPGYPVIPITHAVLQKFLVQFLQGIHSRNRHQKVSPGKTHQPFCTALLIAAAPITETGIKCIVAPKPQERVLFNPVSSQ